MPREKSDTTKFTRAVSTKGKQYMITVPKALIQKLTKRKTVEGTFKLSKKGDKITLVFDITESP